MSTSAVQHTVQIRPSRLAGLLVAVAVLAAATTWSASKLDESHNSATAAPQVSSSGAASKAYVASVIALTEEQRAAIYGNVTASDQHGAISDPQLHVDGLLGISADEGHGGLAGLFVEGGGDVDDGHVAAARRLHGMGGHPLVHPHRRLRR